MGGRGWGLYDGAWHGLWWFGCLGRGGLAMRRMKSIWRRGEKLLGLRQAELRR